MLTLAKTLAPLPNDDQELTLSDDAARQRQRIGQLLGRYLPGAGFVSSGAISNILTTSASLQIGNRPNLQGPFFTAKSRR
jgi:hypothetical protein